MSTREKAAREYGFLDCAIGASGGRPVRDFLTEGMMIIERQIKTRTGITGLATGFSHLDEMLLGLQDGELVVLVGRPATGKTAFALHLLKNIAIEAGQRVLFFSPANSRDEVLRRMLCLLANVDVARLRSGRLDDPHAYMRFCRAADALSHANIHVDDTPAINASALSQQSLHYVGRHEIRLIVIDAVDRMTPETILGARYTELLDTLRCLKSCAFDCRVPVLALTSLCRFPSRQRWLGWRAIEQYADVVLKIAHDRKNLGQDCHALLTVVQQRHGPTGSIEWTFS